MRDRILKLAKRLNKFTLEEISTIAEVEESKLKFVLDNLEEVKKSGEVYLYIPSKQKRTSISALQPKLDYHSKETIDMIIKCFCAEIEVEKTAFLLGLGVNCIYKFNRHFREMIYEKQYQKLFEYYKSKPQIPRLRRFFDKTVYFYVYKNQVFVSNKKFQSDYESPYTEEEVRLMKITYSKIKRRFLKVKHETNIHHHITEQIGRLEKSHENLLKELDILLIL